MKTNIIQFSISGIIFLYSTITLLAWPTDNGISVCTSMNNQQYPKITNDGLGGAIITWADYRNGNADIYAQRLNSYGSTLWDLNGIGICTVIYNQYNPEIISDGINGAYITWEDYRNTTGNLLQGSDIYIKRINSEGSTFTSWPENGLSVCTASYFQFSPKLAIDSSEDVFISWLDYRRNQTLKDIYIQQVDSSGLVLGPVNGLPVCTTAYAYSPTIISNGFEGAFISWTDSRNSILDIYAQRINSMSSTLWTPNGISVCTAGVTPIIVSDSNGGAIIVWRNNQNPNYDIYAQRIDANGQPLWNIEGISICTSFGNQICTSVISDGSGGAFITWYDDRNGDFDIFAQRIDSNGLSLWTTDGIEICTSLNNQFDPQIVSDGTGGAMITWYDNRNGNYDIYAQRINSIGSTLWFTNGIAICTASNDQEYHRAVSDDNGGIIITWQDSRDGFEDIYSQRVDSNGNTNFVPVELSAFEALVAIKD